jgi:chromosome partitioning protein
MIVLFANQKGGVGKSTLAVLFANYASMIEQRKVKVYDMDFQRSLFNKYKSSEIIENERPYPVFQADLSHFGKIKKDSKVNQDNLTIIDLAGKMDDDNLVPIFKESNLIFCPFYYDEYSVTSTFEFCFVVKKINPDSKIFLVPNRVKSSVKYETLESVNEALGRFGQVTQTISDRIDFQRITTSYTPETLKSIVDPLFKQVFTDYLTPQWEINT